MHPGSIPGGASTDFSRQFIPERGTGFGKRPLSLLFQAIYVSLTISGEFGHVFSWRHPPSPNAFGGSLSPAFFLFGAGPGAQGATFHSSGGSYGGISAQGAICLLNRQAGLAIPPSSSCSAIAQLVEQATVNRPVAGSSPARGATFSPAICIRSFPSLQGAWPFLL